MPTHFRLYTIEYLTIHYSLFTIEYRLLTIDYKLAKHLFQVNFVKNFCNFLNLL
jgi:hypothetical protein